MLQIKNLADFPVMISTSYNGGQGRPLYVRIPVGGNTLIAQEELKNWPLGAKENLAESMQMGHLMVNEVTACHILNDKGHLPPTFVACTLDSAILTVAGAWSATTGTIPGWVDAYNAHLLGVSAHTAQDTANLITAARPTTLVTLLAYLTAIRLAFNAHLAAAPPHANADTHNLLGVAPIDLPTAVAFIRELYGKFAGHKKQLSAGGAILDPNAVITY